MRPRVTINCAMTADGKLAGKSRKQVRISSLEDLERVRKLRASSDAILVGVGTILADDPHLTVKGGRTEDNPLRIVLDSRGRTPANARVLDRRARTIIVTGESCERSWSGAEALRMGNERVSLALLLPKLSEMGVRDLLVEGGGETIWSFFSGDFVDRYCVFIGSMILGGGESPTPVDGDGFSEEKAPRLRLLESERLGDGILLSYEVIGHGQA